MERTLTKVRIADLQADYWAPDNTGYQRPLDLQRVDNIVKHFNPCKVSPLHVSRRYDGSLHIIDGNHTANALKKVYGKDYLADSYIYTGLTDTDEARLFYELNSMHKNPTYNEKLSALISSGDKSAKDYYSALQDSGAGFTFKPSNGNATKFCAHSAGMKIFKVYGRDIFIKTLRIIAELNDYKLFSGQIAKGVAGVLARFPECNPDKLKDAIEKNGYNKILARAAIYGTTGAGDSLGIPYCRSLLDFYNVRKHRKLVWEDAK